MKMNNSFNYSNPKMPGAIPVTNSELCTMPSAIISSSLTSNWYWSHCSGWWEASRLRRRDLSSGYGSRQAEGMFHYWWGHILSISAVEEDGAAQADSALFRPPLRRISRVSVSRGWERFGGRERVSYFSLEASPYNCYCVLTQYTQALAQCKKNATADW